MDLQVKVFTAIKKINTESFHIAQYLIHLHIRITEESYMFTK